MPAIKIIYGGNTSCKHEEPTGSAASSSGSVALKLDHMAPKETPNRRSGRKKRVITACAHTNLSHYAMGMCNHCYHKYGRNALATDCAHAGQRKVYAKGKCQSCYINDYNKMRRRERKQ